MRTTSYNGTLTVAFLIEDGTKLPVWQLELIKKVHCSDYITTIVLDLAQETGRFEPKQKTISCLPDSLVSRFLDRKRFTGDAFASYSFSTLQRDCSGVRLVKLASRDKHQFNLAVNLVPWIDETGMADMLGVPVWGLRFGQSADIDDPLAGAYEIITGNPSTRLQIFYTLPQQKGISIIYDSPSSTLTYSSRASTGQLAWKAVECVPRLLKKEREMGSYPSKIMSQDNLPLPGKKEHPTELSPLIFGRWLISFFIKKILKKITREQWILLVGKRSTTSLIPKNLKAIFPPTDRIWADPFCVQRDGRMFIFFEDMPFSSMRGRISCAELNKDGSMDAVTPVLDRAYHLSYPFLLEHGDDLFMIPETAENHTIELYRCSSFPDKWEHAGNLMNDVKAWDTTFIKHNGYWWLFANMAPVNAMSSWDQLHLYYTKKFPTDDWTPHPMNPIIDDVRLSRPAGNIFYQEGKLIRPSQNSEGSYGRGLNFNEITDLSPDQYKEVLIKKQLGSQVSRSLTALHTYNHCGNLVLLDAQVHRYKKLFRSRAIERTLRVL